LKALKNGKVGDINIPDIVEARIKEHPVVVGLLTVARRPFDLKDAIRELLSQPPAHAHQNPYVSKLHRRSRKNKDEVSPWGESCSSCWFLDITSFPLVVGSIVMQSGASALRQKQLA